MLRPRVKGEITRGLWRVCGKAEEQNPSCNIYYSFIKVLQASDFPFLLCDQRFLSCKVRSQNETPSLPRLELHSPVFSPSTDAKTLRISPRPAKACSPIYPWSRQECYPHRRTDSRCLSLLGRTVRLEFLHTVQDPESHR